MSGWTTLATVAVATPATAAISRLYAEGRGVNSPRTSSIVFGVAAGAALAGLALDGLSKPNSVARGLLWSAMPIAFIGGVYKGFFEAGGLGG